MLLFVTLHKDTNTGVKEQKGTEGGDGDTHTHTHAFLSLPSPACQHTYQYGLELT